MRDEETKLGDSNQVESLNTAIAPGDGRRAHADPVQLGHAIGIRSGQQRR